MTPRNRLTIFCAGTPDRSHAEHKIGVCHITNSGDVIGTADFATAIGSDGKPIRGPIKLSVLREQMREGHYRLRVECPACHLSVEYHGPDELRTTIRARAYVGASRLALAQLIGYAIE